MLRSGTTEREVIGARRFDRFWKRADRWGLVVLEPGDLPAAPEITRYMSGAAGLEAVGHLDAARVSYERARDQWPDSAWPWLGLANLSHGRGDLERAQREYVEALARDPANVAARNNLAETLEARGCVERARVEIARAAELAQGTALEAQRRPRPRAHLAAAPASTPLRADDCPRLPLTRGLRYPRRSTLRRTSMKHPSYDDSCGVCRAIASVEPLFENDLWFVARMQKGIGIPGLGDGLLAAAHARASPISTTSRRRTSAPPCATSRARSRK